MYRTLQYFNNEECIKQIKNMKNPEIDLIKEIQDKFFIKFEKVDSLSSQGMIVLGELENKNISEMFSPSEYVFISDGDAWLSDFIGTIRSDGLVLIDRDAGKLYIECPELIMEKLIEISDWLKDKINSYIEWDWDMIKNIPGGEENFKTWISGGDIEWYNYNDLLTINKNNSTESTITTNTITCANTALNTGSITTATTSSVNDVTSVHTYLNWMNELATDITGVSNSALNSN